MPEKFLFGSTGPDVKRIQDDLNLLPSMLPRLTSSGTFDLATKNRAIEFQRQAHLFPDGIIGSITRGRLVDMVAKRSQTISKRSEATPTIWQRAANANVAPAVINPGLPDAEDMIRRLIVEIAEDEARAGGANKVAAAVAAAGRGALSAATLQQLTLAGVVAAKLPGNKDAKQRNTRMGHEKLLNYFHLAAPSLFSDDALIHFGQIKEQVKDQNGNPIPGKFSFHDDFTNLAPMPHWCGIFALWVYKTAGMKVGNWKVGGGIGDVGTGNVKDFRPLHDKKQARKGDIGYFDKIVPPATEKFQHHFILKEVHKDGSLVTIEGNSDPKSNFNIKTDRTLDSLTAVYTAKEFKVV